MKEKLWAMSRALVEADKAFKADEVPVGALVLDPFGKVLSSAHNQKEKNQDPAGHAEVLAIREACKTLKNWRLEDCTLVVTLEPCPMCLSLMVQTRLRQVVFGAYDPKGGALSLNYNFYKDTRLNHRFAIEGGQLHYDCSKILSEFFKRKRRFYLGGQ